MLSIVSTGLVWGTTLDSKPWLHTEYVEEALFTPQQPQLHQKHCKEDNRYNKSCDTRESASKQRIVSLDNFPSHLKPVCN